MKYEFIEKLALRLRQPLPGLESQLKMAPTFRASIPEKEISEYAGVMILLFYREGKLLTVFMKRPEYDGAHSGQISFPGGKKDKTDTSIVKTALRETEEEFGIPASEIQVLGALTRLYIPVSKFEVHPFVGFLSKIPEYKIDKTEVVYTIEVTVEELLNPQISRKKPYTSGKYSGEIPYFDVDNNHIWGATAMILSEFLDVVAEIKL